MQRILVATDGSESANRAVDVAAQFAKRLDASLIIVNAFDHEFLSAGDLNKFKREEGISLGDALGAVSSRIWGKLKIKHKITVYPTFRRSRAQGTPCKSCWR